MKHRTAYDLFAGCGGMGSGLRAAGIQTVGVELDPFAQAAHETNVGPCVLGDVRALSSTLIEAPIVVGGPPCQPYSAAGARAGWGDERAHLILEVPRVARRAQAMVFLVENVPRFAHADGGRPFAALANCAFACGFAYTAFRILNAVDYGVPQNRARLFFVGFRRADHANAFRWPAPTHGPGLIAHVTVRDALGLKGQFRPGVKSSASRGYQGMRFLDVDRPAPTVGASSGAEMLRDVEGQVSRLTLAQQAALMGLPCGWAFPGSVRARRRMIGNAVCPPVARALGLSIQKALGDA